MNSFNTLFNYITNQYDLCYRSHGFKGETKQEYYQWQLKQREDLKKILGIDKMKAVALEPKVVESVKLETYRRDKVHINTQEGIVMPMYVLVPDITNGIPAIALHGHSSNGKDALVGIYKEKYKEKILSYNYSYALELVKQGYIVFCPDLAGSGERTEVREQNEGTLASSCNNLNNALISVGMSLQGVIVFDLMRLIDFIEQYPECNSKKIVCCGFSGGAYSTWWLSALDDRVSVAVGSGFFHGIRDTILYNNLCGCNFVPKMWEYIDIGDLVALSAPRSIYIELGNKDPLNGPNMLDNVYPQLDIVNKVYKLFDKEIELNIEDGEHRWFGGCFEFIDKALNNI